MPVLARWGGFLSQSGCDIADTFWSISLELEKIQKSYTHQMKDFAYSFQMAYLFLLQLL